MDRGLSRAYLEALPRVVYESDGPRCGMYLKDPGGIVPSLSPQILGSSDILRPVPIVQNIVAARNVYEKLHGLSGVFTIGAVAGIRRRAHARYSKPGGSQRRLDPAMGWRLHLRMGAARGRRVEGGRRRAESEFGRQWLATPRDSVCQFHLAARVSHEHARN